MSDLTSGRLLARNTVWNLLGQLLPMAAAVFCVPPLLHSLGVARFGVLSLAWIIVGYFSLFDLGIGRAVTKFVADKLGAGDFDSIPPLVWTALAVMLAMGILGGMFTFLISPWLVHHALKVPQELQHETLVGFYLLAASIPLVTLASCLRGVLEAQQKFAIANLIRVPMSVFSFAGPLLVLPFSHSLLPVILVLVVGRAVGFLLHIVACFHTLPALRNQVSVQKSHLHSLVTFGSWITLSNLLGPIVGYIDRFLVAGLLSVSMVAYYTTPLDMITRLTVIPGSLAGVLFPAFAVSFTQDPDRASFLLARALKYVLMVIFPIVLIIAAFAPEILHLWVGAGFAAHSSAVLRWLAVGVFINCFGQVPFAFVQSANRPDLTAKLYFFELPLFAALIVVLASRFGLQGAAVAWVLRVIADLLLLLTFVRRLLPGKLTCPRWLVLSIAGGPIACAAVMLPASVVVRAVSVFSTLFVFAMLVWFRGLGDSERDFLASVRRRSSVQAEVS